MESSFCGLDSTSGFNLIVSLTICHSRLVSVGRLINQKKLKWQGTRLRIIVSGMKLAASE